MLRNIDVGEWATRAVGVSLIAAFPVGMLAFWLLDGWVALAVFFSVFAPMALLPVVLFVVFALSIADLVWDGVRFVLRAFGAPISTEPSALSRLVAKF